jgi:hypothetical protein
LPSLLPEAQRGESRGAGRSPGVGEKIVAPREDFQELLCSAPLRQNTLAEKFFSLILLRKCGFAQK